ncbi:hypothetical protein RI054_19g86080 [Pseudoscourfieldia marina]
MIYPTDHSASSVDPTLLTGVVASSLKEVAKDFASEFLSPSEAYAREPRLRLLRRFGVQQSDKVRPCDDARRNGSNAATRLVETVALPSIDFVAAVARAFHDAALSRGVEPPLLHLGVDDIGGAYRRVPVSHLHLNAVAFFVPALSRAVIQFCYGLIFGFAASVTQFCRYSKLLGLMIAHVVVLPTEPYVDDFPLIDLASSGTSGQESAAAVARHLGIPFEPAKRRPMAPSTLFLGVICSLFPTRVLFSPASHRVHALLTYCSRVLADSSCSPALASRIAGKLGFLLSHTFGRVGRAGVRLLYAHASQQSDALSVASRSGFRFLHALLSSPHLLHDRQVDFVPTLIRRQASVFTDAADPAARRGVACVLLAQADGSFPLCTFADHIDFHNRISDINQLEAFTVLLSLHQFDFSCVDDVHIFCDNTTAIGVLTKGSCGDCDVLNMIAAAFWLYVQELNISVWISYVPSHANIADAPSRPRTYTPADSFAHLTALGTRFTPFVHPPIPDPLVTANHLP